MTDSGISPKRQGLALSFILATVTLDAIGIGLIFPVMPDLIQEVTGRPLSEAALWGGALASSFAVMQFLFGPVVGALSDHFGRRPVLLISLLVMSADYLVMALAGSIWLLFAARLVSGITAATFSIAAAYIADVTPPDQRGRRFGWDTTMIGVSLAVYGVSFALGQALLVGPLIRRFGEHRAALYGMGVNVATLTALGLVTSPAIALMITPLTALGGVVTPALQAIAPRQTPANAQGELQGVFASLYAIATITAPILMTTTFAAFTGNAAPVFAPGAPFLVAAILMLACIGLHRRGHSAASGIEGRKSP